MTDVQQPSGPPGTAAKWLDARSQGGPWDTTLSVVIDALAESPECRDRDFVRAFAAWMNAHSSRLTLPVLHKLGLEDVLLTFHMRSAVKLVITGSLNNHPGEFTLAVSEREFPFVPIRVFPQHSAEPSRGPHFDVCTLDYGRVGERVYLLRPWATSSGRAEAGTLGRCQLVSTHASGTFIRLIIEESGETIVVPEDAASWGEPLP